MYDERFTTYDLGHMSSPNFLPPSGSRVLVGMSGGVDSSVAAALLVQHGCIVEGGFIKNWSDSKDLWTGECQWRGERRDAIRVAAKLGIPLHTFDFEEQYRKRVLDRMFSEYQSGITPNPDVLCNEEIKFGLFYEKAREMGFEYVATGHYARIERIDGKSHMLKGVDTNKDQTYFLHRISADALQHALFPIGHLQKAEVRALAETYQLSTASKPDSQGICFVGKLDFHEFLRKKNPPTPGDIVNEKGEVLGRHDGLDGYTIGQRHGVFVTSENKSWYVAKKDLVHNQLVIVSDREHPFLYSSSATLESLHLLTVDAQSIINSSEGLTCAIRYRQEPVSCRLDMKNDRWIIHFTKPVWALTPGQSAVVYHGEECLGGGFLGEDRIDSES